MRHGSDEGVATIWVLMLAAVLGTVGAVAIVIASGMALHRQAAAAADLAALAGATRSVTQEYQACSAAAQSAVANNARLIACALQGRSVVVVVRVDSTSAWLPGFSVTARAGYD